MTASGKSLSQRSLEEAAWGSLGRPQAQAHYGKRAAKLAAKEATLKKADAQKNKRHKQRGPGNTN
jgi:hypothetical protein